MEIERKNYEELDAPVGPYVHGVKYNGFLFLSGITAFGTPAQGADLAAQADAVFDQIATMAQAENTDLTNIIKVTVYVTGLDDVDALREVLFRRYGTHLPASSLIKIDALFLPGLKIEVEAVLAV